MGQQHRKIVKRRRRRDYLQRKKELALMEAAKPRLKRPAVKAEAAASPAGEEPAKKAVKKDPAKKAPAKKPATNKKDAPLEETVDLDVVGAGPEPEKIEAFEKEIMPPAVTDDGEAKPEALAEAEAVFLKE